MLLLKDTNSNETAVRTFNVAITNTLNTLSTLSFNFIVDPNNDSDTNKVAALMMSPRTLVTEPETGKMFRLITQNPTTLGKKKLYTVTANSVGFDLHDNYVEPKLLATQSIVACMNYITNGTKFKYVIDGSFPNYSFSEGFGGAYADDLLNNLASDFGFEYYFDNYTIHIAKTIGKDNSFLFVDRANCAKIAINEDYTTIRTHIKGYGKQNDDGSYITTAEYTSPLAGNPYSWGKMDDEPYHSDSITNHDTLLATIKSKLHDYPDIQYSLEYVNFKKNITGFNNDLTVGNNGWLRDRFGIDVSVRLQSVTYYPQDTKNAGTITFGNKIFDPVLWQQKLRKDYQTNKNLGQTLKNELAQLNKSNQSAIAEMQNKINELESNGILVEVDEKLNDYSQDFFNKLRLERASSTIIRLSNGSEISGISAAELENSSSAGLIEKGVSHYFKGLATTEANVFLSQVQAQKIETTKLVVIDVEDSVLSTDKNTLSTSITTFLSILTAAGYTNTCIKAPETWFGTRFSNGLSKYIWFVDSELTNRPDGSNIWLFNKNWKGNGVAASYSYI